MDWLSEVVQKAAAMVAAHAVEGSVLMAAAAVWRVWHRLRVLWGDVQRLQRAFPLLMEFVRAVADADRRLLEDRRKAGANVPKELSDRVNMARDLLWVAGGRALSPFNRRALPRPELEALRLARGGR